MASQKNVEIPGVRPIKEWLRLFSDVTSPVCKQLGLIVGPEPATVTEQAAFAVKALEAFARQFKPDAKVLLVRSAGRINLMGMHVDHRGGACNPIAVRTSWLICEPREDDRFICASFTPDIYKTGEFSLREELGPSKIADWDKWTLLRADERKAKGLGGDWMNYMRSAPLYLQFLRTADDGKFQPALKGMNVLVASDLPAAAGLSSSSGLVVGMMMATDHVNRLNIETMKMIEMCGHAEWYVGTRGGAGDHAAITLGKLDHISHVGNHPFTVSHVPFPSDYRVILANSLVEAKKTEGARDAFNNRVACYEFGLLMLRLSFPEFAAKMKMLRDVTPEGLGVDEAMIYRMIGSLPEAANRAQIRAMLPAHLDRVQAVFNSHAEPAEGYKVRQRVAFGITEIMRSDLAAECLKHHDLKTFAEICNISHNGDRVTVLKNGQRVPLDTSIPDSMIAQKIADLRSGDAKRVEAAHLWRLPGGYEASLKDIDEIVDICLAVKGCLAARIVGAGLGGSVHCVVHKDHADAIIAALAKQYYGPRKLEPAAEVYRPVGGAQIFGG